MRFSPALSLVALLARAAFAGGDAAPSIVPRPTSLQVREGAFVLRPDSVIVTERAAAAEAHRLARALAPALGRKPKVVVSRQVASVRQRRRLCGKKAGGGCRTWIRFDRVSPRRATPESYTLEVSPGVAVVRAADGPGWFYGAQSLRQLLPAAIFANGRTAVELAAPCVSVFDTPRFRWRGAMLDVGRHFMPKATVLKLLDLLALHKLNRFHWHLTDDQGWRLEVRRYPKLTSVGSMRAESPVRPLPHGAFLNFLVNTPPMERDGIPHGGFYTQDEIREVIAYAAARHIEIVPEIDMPGHISSAIAAYPELGNTGVPIPVSTVVGIHEDILNVDDATFTFIEGVLEELLGLFPGEFVHVGADEVPFVQWEASPAAQARMAEEGFTHESQLATYFTNRVGALLTGRGRRVIAWNDALRDGLAPGTAIMSWTSAEPGTLAAQAGREVVMAPFLRTYFDHANALPLPPDEQAILEASPGASLAPAFVTTIEEAYGFEPVPSALTPDEAAHILGGQAQLWTEWMHDGRDVERAAFPRLAAFSETVWTAKELRDYADFAARLPAHLQRLDAMDVCYFGRTAPQCP